MNHHVQNPLYDTCNTLVELNQKTKPLPFIDVSKLCWYFERSEFVNNFICIFIKFKFYIATCWVHYTLFFGEIKVSAMANWIVYVSELLLTYLSSDKLPFSSPLLSYWM